MLLLLSLILLCLEVWVYTDTHHVCVYDFSEPSYDLPNESNFILFWLLLIVFIAIKRPISEKKEKRVTHPRLWSTSIRQVSFEKKNNNNKVVLRPVNFNKND